MKRGDLALIVLVAAAAVGGGTLWLLGGGTGAGGEAGLVVVCQSKEGFYRADPLDVDATYTVKTSEGVNEVRIHAGEVEVERADCSNQVCVEHEPIDAAGEQIVCLPHGVVVQVAASEADVPALS